MEKSTGFTEEETEKQRERFCSAYQIVEEAGLEDEYEEWKESSKKETGQYEA